MFLPLQTDFKTADSEVNTDQDIEKNLVSVLAVTVVTGNLSNRSGAVLSQLKENARWSANFYFPEMESLLLPEPTAVYKIALFVNSQSEMKTEPL